MAALTTGANEFNFYEWLWPASVSFSPATMTVLAGGTATVSVAITASAARNLFTYGG